MDNPFDGFGNPIEIARIIWDTEDFTAALGKAESGDAEAQYRLGMMYQEGGNSFAGKDEEEAAKWLGKAAQQGRGRS